MFQKGKTNDANKNFYLNIRVRSRNSRIDPFGAFRIMRRCDPSENLPTRTSIYVQRDGERQIHIERLEIPARENNPRNPFSSGLSRYRCEFERVALG